MAKVTDLNEIASMADSLIDDYCPVLVEKIGRTQAIFCVVAIYTTNDICKGYGQNFNPYWDANGMYTDEKVSVISFENGISIIDSGKSSRYQDRFPMCGYEDLHDDLYQIAIDIQACFDRIAG